VVIPGNATELAALGWLHANCGNACHNAYPNALATDTGLWMRLTTSTLGAVSQTDTWNTAVGVRSNFQAVGDGGLLRIAPRDTSNSAIYFRASFRDDQGQGWQMPPIATHVVDDAGVQAIGAWIRSMP
jgi:hypothetical protein